MGDRVDERSLPDDATLVYQGLCECMRKKFPDLPESVVLEMWDEGIKRNEKIIEYLGVLRDYNSMIGEKFKSIAYSKAIRTLRSIKIPVVSAKQAKKYAGIGQSIAKKIEEIIETGGLVSVDHILSQEIIKIKAVSELMGIYGIGIQKAKELIGMGVYSIEQLKDYVSWNPSALSGEQLKGLEYYEHISQKIPRDEITYITDMIRHDVVDKDPNVLFAASGSYRRGLPTSGDIDLLISTSMGMKGVLGVLKDMGILLDEFKKGPTVFTGILKYDYNGETKIRQLDIHLTDPEDWPTALIHFTGSGPFNVKLRLIAKDLGYKLSDKGLFKGNQKITGFQSEEDVFRYLGTDYLPPEKRV